MVATAALALPCVYAQQGTGSPGQATTPGTPTTAAPSKVTADADTEHGVQLKTVPANPKAEKLEKSEGGLTFLPELKPTDGVPDLAPQRAALLKAESAGDAPATLLDRAVAVIDGEVILDSDVREQQHFAVFEPLRVPNGKFSPLEAMQQIVNRTLLLHQMTAQQLVSPPADAAVDEQIDELRKHIPACAGQACETAAGWHRFLAAQGFTEAGLHERWKSRMQILNFIEVRFRNGIRIGKPEIETYYQQRLVPEFQTRRITPPPLANVSTRIDEILLQQHVNVLLGDYLRSLKDAGNVQILDPAYNQLGKTAAASNNPEPSNPEPEPLPGTAGVQ